jgi:uncharacterized protein (TIGR00251 family)
MTDFSEAVRTEDDGITITIDVTAGAKKDFFPAGYNEWRKAIKCSVSAPAVGGKANKAIIGMISETLGIPKSSVSIVHGMTSSLKKVHLTGIGYDDLAGLL